MPSDLSLAAGFMGGVGNYEAGKTRSLLFRANSSIAAQQAKSELEAGAYNESMVRMRGAALQGQQVAQIGASNLQQAGSPAAVVASSAMVNEMDALETRNNSLRKAWGFQVQQVSDNFQAKQATTAGINEAFGSILSGGSKAYSQYSDTKSFF